MSESERERSLLQIAMLPSWAWKCDVDGSMSLVTLRYDRGGGGGGYEQINGGAVDWK